MSNRIQSPSCRGCHSPRCGVTPPVLTCQTLCPASPIPAGRWAGRGRLVLLVFICLFPRCYDNPPESTSRATSSNLTEPVTGGVCHTSLWLGLCVVAIVSLSPRGGTITHITLLKASLSACGTCSSWLLVLPTVDNKISS